MSDYLWDKRGEPEADVERLENLLGALKYEQRPLEIPATAVPSAARPAATTIFSRPRLAIAASLILMLLAGTWLITRQSEQRTTDLAKVKKQNVTDEREQPGKKVVSDSGTSGNVTVSAAATPTPGVNEAGIIQVTISKRQRSSRQSVAKRRQLQPRRGETAPAAPPREEVATNLAPAAGLQFDQTLTPQQREATEQLMFALRLASAKLNYAQREMREIGRAGK